MAVRRSADAMAGSKSAGLARLGAKLSGKGAGSADRSVSAGAQVRGALFRAAGSEGPRRGTSGIQKAATPAKKIGKQAPAVVKPKKKSAAEGFRDYSTKSMTPAQRKKSFRKNTPVGGKPGQKNSKLGK